MTTFLCRIFVFFGGPSTSAWCQLGNGLRIANSGSGQWKRLRSRIGHALDDDDNDEDFV